MRITRRYLAVAAAIVLTTTSLPGQAESADETAVKKAIDDLVKAMTAADKAALEAVVTERLSFGHSNGMVENKAEFVGGIASKNVIYKSITLSDPTIIVVGNDAIARYTANVDVQRGGNPISLKLGVMTVWIKAGGTWKLLAYQAFRT